jgi:hypothetical protein
MTRWKVQVYEESTKRWVDSVHAYSHYFSNVSAQNTADMLERNSTSLRYRVIQIEVPASDRRAGKDRRKN